MRALAAGSLILCAFTASSIAKSGDILPGVPVNPDREAYYGDLHLHTTYSFDVYLYSSITPDEAYRFARGEPVIYLNETVRRSEPPLDFLAITDHADNIGVFNALDDPKSLLSQSNFGKKVHEEGGKLVGKTTVKMFDGLKHLSQVADVPRATVNSLASSAWEREKDAANRNYRPGKFTTFIGFEWSSQPGMQNLHRNVIFRGNDAPLPFCASDSLRPEDLWRYLERARMSGFDALAIIHNPNASNGMMFDLNDSDGNPIDPTYAKLRAGNEPLVEISQQAGQSETLPALSPEDEFADFEIMDFMSVLRKGHSSKTAGSYVRDALGRGMEIATRSGGVNPFKYGFVAASDIHSGLSESSEAALAATFLKSSEVGKTSSSRGNTLSKEAIAAGASEQMAASYPGTADQSSQGKMYQTGSPGLTGVWAEQNTRESIFAALRRRETFATSGTRLRFRFFGGWSYSPDLPKSRDWIKRAYGTGVPMGGDLPARPAGRQFPTFIFWASKDPRGANLDRIQVVKVWLERGKHQEAVYDVALAGERKVDPDGGKTSKVGNTVNLGNATYTDTIGSAQLSAVWQDMHFDSTAPAAYYLRVLEIPTPRYSTILAVKKKQALPSGVPATIQERGWSSPIWYTPPGISATPPASTAHPVRGD